MIDREAFFKSYLDRFNQLLPLKVIGTKFENAPELCMWGENFSFNTLSSWRITKSNQYVCGHGDYEESKTYDVLSQLFESNLVTVTLQSDNLKVDPVFYFSNGYILEIFSTYGYEPWTLDSPCGFIEG